jgi:hypothetical protein
MRPRKLLPRFICDRGSCFRGFNETAEADFDDFLLKYLGEFEAIFEKALARESGP